MVDHRRARELADEDEEDRIADPEARRDEGHRDHIKGDEQPAEVELRGNLGRQADVAERSGDRRAGERNEHREAERSEEHTSELQSLMRISYAVFCLKKKKQTPRTNKQQT